MSDEDENNDWESAVALRAKAADFMGLAKIMGEQTRARLIRIANDFLERAAILEQKRDE
jgi:hypothetical protein